MTSFKDVAKSVDEYIDLISSIQTYYSLYIDDIKSNIGFLNTLSSSGDILDKINKEKNDLLSKVNPNKLFKGYKKDNTYTANKYMTLYISPKGTTGIYFNNGVDKEKKTFFLLLINT